jgi:hypothetical protein
MICQESQLPIVRPPAGVFAFVSDIANGPRWQTGLHEVRRLTPGPLRVGTEHDVIRRFAGRQVASRNRFVAVDPGQFVAFEFPQGSITRRHGRGDGLLRAGHIAGAIHRPRRGSDALAGRRLAHPAPLIEAAKWLVERRVLIDFTATDTCPAPPASTRRR